MATDTILRSVATGVFGAVNTYVVAPWSYALVWSIALHSAGTTTPISSFELQRRGLLPITGGMLITPSLLKQVPGVCALGRQKLRVPACA